MAATLCMNGGRSILWFEGHLHDIAVVDGKVRYRIDGVEKSPPVATARSVSLASCDNCVAAVWATGTEVRFRASDGKGTWQAERLLWRGAGEQPSLHISPLEVTATWHADVSTDKEQDGLVYVWHVEGDDLESLVSFPGKFPSIAAEANVVVFRSKRSGTWAVYLTSARDWVSCEYVGEGKDPSVAVYGGSTAIAWQNASDIYLRDTRGKTTRIASPGLYPAVAFDGAFRLVVAYERPQSKGASKDNATKRVGLAVYVEGIVTDVSPPQLGLSYANVTPDGTTWIGIASNGEIDTGAVR